LLLAADDGYPRQLAFDIQHYRLQISISDTTDAIEGKAEVQVRVVDPSVRRIVFDLKDMWVSEVREDEDSVAFSHLEGRLAIDLQKTYERDAQANITILYRGTPQEGLIISKNQHDRRTFFADNWPDRASFWFPSIDHPSDKATVELTITAPQEYEVIANGRLLLTRDNDAITRTWYWAESVPIPAYCMVFGATDFSTTDLPSNGITTVSYHVFPEDSGRAQINFSRANQIVEYFTKVIGPFPYEKLALVQSTTRYGGMENASAIFFAEKSVAGDRNIDGLVAHEIAHQWFGDSVTESDWHHLWLSEGFATYFQMLFTEHADGREAFRAELLRNKDNYLEFAENNRRPIIDTTIFDYPRLLNANNYQKAALVLHTLRNQVGDEVFFRGVREYYSAYRDMNALTVDFQKVIESASGQLLGWFFDQWFWRSGHPQLAINWSWNKTTQKLVLQINQQQPDEPFRFRLPIRVASGGRVLEQVIEVDEREEKVELSVQIKPQQIFIDPDETLLKTVVLSEATNEEISGKSQ
jgi:aminopeptidase N